MKLEMSGVGSLCWMEETEMKMSRVGSWQLEDEGDDLRR